MKYKIIFFLLLTVKLNSQTPDSSFGTNGVLEYNTSQIKSNDLLRSAQLQADGKFLFLTDTYLARYDMFDNLDLNFGQCGMIEINGARTMVLLNSQKIIVYSSTNNSTNKQIFKYDTNGSLDITFGNNGVLQLPILNNIVINQIIETLDNKIVLGGAIHNGTKSDYLLIRLNSNGTLDNSFDLDGIAQYSIGSIQDIGSALALQPDNKVLLTGKSKTSTSNDDFATIRVTNTGTLDISFGTNGVVITDFTNTTTSNDYPTSISIDTNKIYVAGTSSGNLSLARYNINGNIDYTFNTTGKLVISVSASNSLSSTRLDLNGGVSLILSQKINLALSSTKLILAIRNSSNAKYHLLSIDKSTLQVTGNQYGNINANFCNYLFVSDIDIFFGGSSGIGTNTFNSIIRLKYDTNYQFSSLSVINNKQSTERGTHLFTSVDNSIYVKSKNPDKLKKILSNGIEDNTFAFSGIINDWYLFKDSNNKLYTLDNNSTILYRYNSNGSIDNTFGVSGALDLTNYQNGCVTFIDDIRLDNNNNIYIVFDFDHNINNGLYNDVSFGVIKTNYQGQIDSSFGTNSIASYRFNSTSTNDLEIPVSLIINNDSIVVHGWTKSPTSNYLDAKSLFFKIDLNGNLILSFGLNGKKIIDGIRVYESNLYNSAYFYKGTSDSQESNKLVKIDQQGNVDLSFGNNGVLTVNQLDICNVFKIKSCDGIYVAGSKNNQFAITKFNFDGTIATSFGTNGIYVKTINCYSSINAIDFSQNNTLLAVGYSWNGIGEKVILLQLNGLPNNNINVPTANATQTFNAGDTLANLTVTGSNLQWYSAASGGSPLPLNTTLVSGTTYYVSQTVNGCESSRIAITVTQNLSNESFVLNGFIIYPNPTSSILNFKSLVAVEKIAIYNMLGQLVQQEKVNALDGAINIEKLAQGTYLVKINDIAKGYTIIKN